MLVVKRLSLMVLCLGLVGCGAQGGGGTAGNVKTDKGVTARPCPGSPHKDRGCIYLGSLSDLTEGPFAPLGVPITQAQKDFWARVNAQGGIGGKFDVDVTRYTRDNKYNPQEHVARLREVEPHVLALAQSLGTPMTIAARPVMAQADLIAAPATWWSGWAFEDDGRVLESGQSYCTETMNGLDYMLEKHGRPNKVLVVAYAGDYGGDVAGGAEIWGRRNRVPITKAETAPNAQAGSQDAAVSAIRREGADVVLLATGPAEMAEIVGKSVAGGFDGQFIGSGPTYNPAALKSQAAPAIKSRYRFSSPWAPYGSDSAAHRAMRQAAGSKPPVNEGYNFGWVLSYPLKAALEQAARNGDLTRKGLRAAVNEVTVDYEGALPERRYGGDPNESMVRTGLILRPDDAAPLGASVEKPAFTGPTAKEHRFSGSCSA